MHGHVGAALGTGRGGNKLHLEIDRYFDSGPTVMDWNMKRLIDHWSTFAWRRTLEEWSRLILDAGFLIRRMLEPRPHPAQLEALPQLEDCARLPYFLSFDLVTKQ